MSRDLYRPFDASDSQTNASTTEAPKPETTRDFYRPWVEPEPEPKADEGSKEALIKEPLDPVTKRVLEAASVAGGAAAGAGLKYRAGMFGPEEGSKFMFSRPGMGVDALTQFQLGTKPGQVTEEARRTLQDLLAKFEAAQAIHSQEAVGLRAALDRAISQLPEASMERNIALARLAEMGGIKAPSTPPLSSPSIVGTGDVINRIQNATTSSGQPVSSLAREMGQHEFQMQAKALREAGARTVDDLLRLGVVDRSLAQYMVDNGMLLPTPEGRVLVRPQVLMGTEGQAISAEDAAARQAAREAEEAAALARRKAEILRAQEVEQARLGYRTAGKTAATLESTIPMLTEKYAAHVGMPSPAATKLEPNINMAREALSVAQGQMPSKLGYAIHGVNRALPVAGGALSVAGAGEFGTDAYARSREGDPIGAAISGIGAGFSLGSLYAPIVGGVGALTSAGLLALYDKYGPSILPILEKKGVIPRDWNPANYSVMDKYAQ